MNTNTAYNQLLFKTLNDSSRRICEKIQEFINDRRSFKILDLGCGTGSDVFKVSDMVSNSTLIGVDLSKDNIAAAELQSTKHKTQNNIRFAVCDYLQYQIEPMDIIFAESVLHLIPGDTKILCQKISGDLKSDSILIVTMPYDCLYNRLLYDARSLLTLFKSRFLNYLIFTLSKRVYSHLDPETLKSRIPYMYILPERFDSDNFRREMAAFELVLITEEKLPSSSFTKMKHKLLVFKKN